MNNKHFWKWKNKITKDAAAAKTIKIQTWVNHTFPRSFLLQGTTQRRLVSAQAASNTPSAQKQWETFPRLA